MGGDSNAQTEQTMEWWWQLAKSEENLLSQKNDSESQQYAGQPSVSVKQRFHTMNCPINNHQARNKAQQ